MLSKRCKRKLATLLLFTALSSVAQSPSIDPVKAMDGFDDYMAKVLKDWNGVGIGVAVVSRISGECACAFGGELSDSARSTVLDDYRFTESDEIQR